MRHAPTESEAALWRALSAGRSNGLRFRRQVPVGPFVADFLALPERVIVEVDGGYHSGRRAADARRDAKLTRWGYRIVRLDAELVLRDLPAALERILAALVG